MIISFVISAIVVLIDQLTKLLIYGITSKPILGDLLWFHSTLNTGVAFSLFQNMTIFFSVISFIASIIFIYLIASKKFFQFKAEKIILGFILGGTVGNLIDRVFLGGVRDFIYLKFIDFPIFNVADMAVSLGAIALCIFIVFFELKDGKNVKKTANHTEFSDNNAQNMTNSADIEEVQDIKTEMDNENKDLNNDFSDENHRENQTEKTADNNTANNTYSDKGSE